MTGHTEPSATLSCCDVYRHLTTDPLAACPLHDEVREEELGFDQAEIDVGDELLDGLLEAVATQENP